MGRKPFVRRVQSQSLSRLLPEIRPKNMYESESSASSYAKISKDHALLPPFEDTLFMLSLIDLQPALDLLPCPAEPGVEKWP